MIWDHCKACTPQNCPKGILDWIQCDICNEWFHYICINLDINSKYSKSIEKFHCSECAKKHGNSILRRVSKRNLNSNVNYIALNEGDVELSKSKLIHPHIYTLLNYKFSTKENFIRMNSSDFTKEWILKNGLFEPIIIPKNLNSSNQFNLNIPSNININEISNLIGLSTPIEVMDVFTQDNELDWTMEKWLNYFETDENSRKRILNVISLEISNTPLGEKIKKPNIINYLDLLKYVWPEKLKKIGDYPKSSLYCLMSVSGSYTDFHIDFGGSSVFYHIIDGAKTFLFIKPTKANLNKYEKWCNSSDQNKIFLPTNISNKNQCYKIDLNAGDSMIIPSGWIHAVYTPKDTLVIGGNFLTKINIPLQFQIYEIEKQTKVPKKFQFPYFERIFWFAAKYYVKQDQNILIKNISKYEFEGLFYLKSFLEKQLQIIQYTKKNPSDLKISKQDIKIARDSVPKGDDPNILLDNFTKWLNILDSLKKDLNDNENLDNLDSLNDLKDSETNNISNTNENKNTNHKLNKLRSDQIYDHDNGKKVKKQKCS